MIGKRARKYKLHFEFIFRVKLRKFKDAFNKPEFPLLTQLTADYTKEKNPSI